MRTQRRWTHSPWRWGGALLLALVGASAALAGCAIATPLRTTAAWKELQPVGPDLTVALTYAELDPARRAVFDAGTARLFERLDAVDGLLAYSRRKRLFGSEAWTLTLWRDERAHDGFVDAQSHSQARREGRPALVKAKFLTLPWPRERGLPKWSELLPQLDALEPLVYFHLGAPKLAPVDD